MFTPNQNQSCRVKEFQQYIKQQRKVDIQPLKTQGASRCYQKTALQRTQSTSRHYQKSTSNQPFQAQGCQNCEECIQNGHKNRCSHLSHGLHGIGNGCQSVQTNKLQRAVQNKVTSAALITKYHSQHRDGSGFTKLSQHFGQSSFLRRDGRCLLLPLMIFVTTDQPYMRDIIQKPLRQHVPHYWFAVVIMIQPFQITVLVKKCNNTVVVSTPCIASVVHQRSNLIGDPCNAQPGISKARYEYSKIAKLNDCTIDCGGILKSAYLTAKDMRGLFHSLQHTI